MNVFEELSQVLYDFFVGNDSVYAEQKDDGNYYTVYKTVIPKLLNDMLQNKGSYLSYQFKDKTAKWICIDFDIAQHYRDSTDFDQKKDVYFKDLLLKVSRVCHILDQRGIGYLSEFSGNRGIHIWIIFEKGISRELAFEINDRILELSDLKSKIELETTQIDIFPTSPKSKSRIGMGVKIPLSFHKKSKKYSYLIEKIAEFEYDASIFFETLDEGFLEKQLKVLRSYQKQKPEIIAEKLNVKQKKKDEQEFIRIRQFNLQEPLTIDKIIEDLSSCQILKDLFKRYYKDKRLKEVERIIVVGLLNRLKTYNNKKFGAVILFEFFSRMENFRENLTRKKLKNLNLYPITCTYLKSKFGMINCKCEEIHKSPIEYIESIEIPTEEVFELTEDEIKKIVTAQIKYTKKNDEIPLFPIIEELEAMESDISILLEQIKSCIETGKWDLDYYYQFERIEEGGKTRKLISLNALDKVITTYCIKILDSLLYGEFLENAYGYRFENSFANDNIFKPWLQQWNIFRKKVNEKLFNEAFKDYYLIRLDIKSFYPSIDLGRLQEKLFKKLIEEAPLHLSAFDPLTQKRVENVIKILLTFCTKLANGNKGVPQGPAFARYLAELYLLDVDKYIVKQLQAPEDYYRYVDDFYIVVDNKEKAEELSQHLIELVTNLLLEVTFEKKDGKYFLGTIEHYIKNFYDETAEMKYNLQFISQNIKSSSQERLVSAIKEMNRLIGDIDNKEIKNENLSFFITQFTLDPVIREQRKELEEYILNMETGRGSLFRNFFEFYFHFMVDEIHFSRGFFKLRGLKREVLLNTLLKKIMERELNKKEVLNIKGLLHHFHRDRLSKIEMELILLIMLVKNGLFDENIFYCLEEEIIERIFNFQFKSERINLIIPLEVIKRLNESNIMRKKDLGHFILVLYRLIMFNQLKGEVIKESADIFFHRFFEHIKVEIDEHHELEFFKNVSERELLKSLTAYFNLLCLFTVSDSEYEYSSIEKLWRNLIYNINVDGFNLPEGLQKETWLSKVDDIDFKEKNLSSLLAAKLGDGFKIKCGDKHQVFDEFYLYVLIAIYSRESNKKILSAITSQIDKNKIFTEMIKNGKMKFLEWIMESEKGKRAELYPSRDECFKNIAINDRIVLKRADQILVRLKSKHLNPLKEGFDYLPNLHFQEEEYFDKKYTNIIYSYDYREFVSLKEKLEKADTIFELIGKVIDVEEGTKKFINMYTDLNTNEKFPNIFSEKYSIRKNDCFPLIPYSLFDQKIIFEHEAIDNNKTKFYELLLQKVSSSSKEIFPYKHECNISGENLKKHFYKIVSDNIETFEYLKEFNEEVSKLKIPYVNCPFNIEFLKIFTIYRRVSKKFSKIPLPVEIIYNILRDYHNIYSLNELDRKLFFDFPVNPSGENTLKDFFFFIIESVKAFLKKLGRNFNEKEIIPKILANELLRLESGVQNILQTDKLEIPKTNVNKLEEIENIKEMNLPELRMCKIRYDAALEELTLDDTLIVKENKFVRDEVYVFFTKGVKLLSEDEDPTRSKFIKLNPNNPGTMNRIADELPFYTYRNNKYIIIVLEDVLNATFKTIKKRKKRFDEAVKYAKYERLDCYKSYVETEDYIRNLTGFKEAVTVLKDHHYGNEEVETSPQIEARLIRWLCLFEKKYIDPLVNVIACHKTINKNEIDDFVKSLENYKDKGILFTIKEFNDFNGLYRLIGSDSRLERIQRGFLRLNESVDKVLALEEGDISAKPLIIISDIIIKGIQIEKALTSYYLRDSYHKGKLKRRLKKERYFPVLAEDEKKFKVFKGKFEKFKKIIFITTIYTDEGEKNLRKICTKKFGITNPEKNILFKGKKVDFKDYTLEECNKLYEQDRKRFSELIKNKILLEQIFEFDEKIKHDYDDQIEEIEEGKPQNLITRLRSVPKKGFKIFTLTPKNRNVKSLFQWIEEF